MKPDLEDPKKTPELNPSEQDYQETFDSITGTPDMQALDDQGDAITREHQGGDDSLARREAAASANTESTTEDADREKEAISRGAGESADPQDDMNFTGDGEGGGEQSFMRRVRGKITKRNAAITGGVVAVGGIGLIAFNALLPLKVVHMMENLTSTFSSFGEEAVKKRGDQLFSYYMKRHVLKNMGPQCRSTVDRRCTSRVPGQSQASYLFRGWKDAKLETKLAEKYGLTFRWEPGSDRVGGNKLPQWYVDFKNGGPSANITDFVGNNNMYSLYESSELRGRKEVRAAVRDALAKETKLKRTWLRFKVGKLLERKYNIRRCVVACDAKDTFTDWKIDKKQAYKVKLVERVVEPRNQTVAIIFNCLIEISACSGDGDRGENGEPRSAVEAKLEKQLAEYANKLGSEALEELLQKATTMSEEGLTQYVLKKVVGEATAKLTSKALPYVGWIDFAITLKDLAKNSGTVIKVAKYSMYATTSVSTYQMFRSHADEIKAGRMDAELAGSFTTALGETDDDQGSGKSPLWNELYGAPTSTTSFMEGSAHAAEPTRYKCGEDGKSEDVKNGELICDEESFAASGALNELLGGVASVANNPVLDSVSGPAEGLWKSTVRPVINLPGKILSPVVDSFLSATGLAGVIGDFVNTASKWVVERVIGNPFGVGSTPARLTQTLVAGASAGMTENCNTGQGCKEINSEQARAIMQDYNEDKLYAMKQKSLFARFFDLNDSDSALSSVAMNMPTSLDSFMRRGVAYALNPFQSSQSFVAASFSTPAFAATSQADSIMAVNKALSIKTLGIPLDDPIFSTDPDLLTEDYCKEVNDDWFEGKGEYEGTLKEDPDTGYKYHTATNPCLLEAQTTGALGAMYTDEVLKEDEIK